MSTPLLEERFDEHFVSLLHAKLIDAGGPGKMDEFAHPGGISVTFDWNSGERIGMSIGDHKVSFYLSTTCAGLDDREQNHATYKKLVASLPGLFKGAGIKEFHAHPIDDHSKAILMAYGGFEERSDDRLVWTL